jgi:hypothetical protein
LIYTADPQRTERTRAAVIDTMNGQNSALHAEPEKAFADDAVLKEFERVMHSVFHRSKHRFIFRVRTVQCA